MARLSYRSFMTTIFFEIALDMATFTVFTTTVIINRTLALSILLSLLITLLQLWYAKIPLPVSFTSKSKITLPLSSLETVVVQLT